MHKSHQFRRNKDSKDGLRVEGKSREFIPHTLENVRNK